MTGGQTSISRLIRLSRSESLFRAICDGYGFAEVEQSGVGVHCDGCHTVHKLPVKMYSDGKECLCRLQVIYSYNDMV